MSIHIITRRYSKETHPQESLELAFELAIEFGTGIAVWLIGAEKDASDDKLTTGGPESSWLAVLC